MVETHKCPVCGHDPDEAGTSRYKPFCSKRCADIDLGRWLHGAYTIPATENKEDEAERPPEAGPGDIPN